ncbi:hypothetical protein DVH24_035682 [Malus domestica]|uniref:Uncharacterized protein n=1 Tax=Malus domestica TaxID=3750 RepID=A0A498JT64_MALDO|nr:hypothetical protein DVH24_035682 [Malus domestica]
MVSQPPSSGQFYGSSSSTISRPFTRENKVYFLQSNSSYGRYMFQKHGIPEWFVELKKKLHAKERAVNGASGSRAFIAAAALGNKKIMPTQGDPSQTLLTKTNPSESSSNIASDIEYHTNWILDSGAIDHMTFNKNLFTCM